MSVSIVGVAWYRPADYPRVLEIMADADQLPETFEKWRYEADKARRELVKEGFVVVKVILDPAQFSAWCEKQGRTLDAGARSRWAAEEARRMDLPTA